MGEDERLPPLTRRVPSENRGHRPAGQVGMPQLPDEVVARMLAAVRADAAAEAALQDPVAELAAPAPAPVQPADQQPAAPPKATAPDAAAEPRDRTTHHEPGPSKRARKRTAHASRQAAEQQRAEARQRAEQERRAEQGRRAEQDRRAEQERQAEDDRQAEQERRAEDDWRAEQNRRGERSRRAEPPAAELPRRPAPPWTSAPAPDPNPDADTDEFPVVAAADGPAEAAVSTDPAGAGAAERSAVPDRPVPPPAPARPPARVPVRAAVSAPVDLGRPLARSTHAGRRQRLLAAAAAGVAIVVGGSLLLALRPDPSASAGARALQRAAVTRDQAAAWITAQVGHATILSCDPVMCGALESRGYPAPSLRKLAAGGSPMTAGLVVATAAVRQQLGGQLSASDAPAVLARFGSRASRIEVRVVAQHGAAAYWAAVSADVQERKESGSLLLTSERIGAVPGQADPQMKAGKIDSRVLYTLTNLAATRPIDIVAFGAGGPGADLRVSPLRSAEVEQVPDEPNLPDNQFISEMLAVVRGQQAPYVVASARQVRLPGGQLALRIEFFAPSPLLLIDGSGTTGG
jgi:hypothetical protein